MMKTFFTHRRARWTWMPPWTPPWTRAREAVKPRTLRTVLDAFKTLETPRAGVRWTVLEIIIMIVRSVVLAYGALLTLSLVSPRARRGVRKVQDAARASAHVVLSDEKKWKKDASRDPRTLLASGSVERRKTVVFVRHGESTWNEVFNRKFDHTFPTRLIGGVLREMVKFFERDSFFIDSPLSALGVEQARALSKHFDDLRAKGASEDEVLNAILGVGTKKSVIVSSNLRRAVNTTANALWSRLSASGSTEKIVIHSALQEVARNVDTYALASNKGDVVPTPTLARELRIPSLGDRELFDATENAGQKPLGRKGVDSFREFAAWVMNQDAEVVIAGGHSIWFREWFREFLPRDSQCAGKSKKIVNCGVVSFDLCFGRHPDHGEMYAVDNVREIYGGFAK